MTRSRDQKPLQNPPSGCKRRHVVDRDRVVGVDGLSSRCPVSRPVLSPSSARAPQSQDEDLPDLRQAHVQRARRSAQPPCNRHHVQVSVHLNGQSWSLVVGRIDLRMRAPAAQPHERFSPLKADVHKESEPQRIRVERWCSLELSVASSVSRAAESATRVPCASALLSSANALLPSRESRRVEHRRGRL